MKGTLYGVSVGPGDPELITVKALSCLKASPVIAAPRTRGKNSLALDVVKSLIEIGEKEILFLDFAMSRDKEVMKSAHRLAVGQVISRLEEGSDVAMINLGDASLYGTWGYIRDIVCNAGYETVTIPGVTSFCAAAAALGESLTEMGDPMTVIPGSCNYLRERLSEPGAKVLMKSASSLPQVRQALKDAGLYEKASAVADCGLPSQRVFRSLEELGDDESYFLTILVK
ncbi:MAG: precorrin-2 C(20)-methyltransferase [Oscillospiraceae bacterium]|nr:precorrin-2 C(20)-methyltransferase [Oscillospiraceae bacterium]